MSFAILITLISYFINVGLGAVSSESPKAAIATTNAVTPPNILMVVIDDIGYGDFSFRGSDYPTPHIDELARSSLEAKLFTQTAAWCAPTRMSLLTGKYAFRFPSYRGKGIIGENNIYKLCKGAGYRTAHFGKAHVAHSRFLDDIGADFKFFLADSWSAKRPREMLMEMDGTARKFMQDSVESNEPFFVYYAPFAVHGPVPTASSYESEAEINLAGFGARSHYAKYVSDVDARIGSLLKAIDKAGARDNTIVMLMSDNGAPTRSRPYDSRMYGSNAPLKGMKSQKLQGGIQTLFLARWPGKMRTGVDDGNWIGGQDLVSTLADLAKIGGAKFPADALTNYQTDGISRADVLLGAAESVNGRRMARRRHSCRPMVYKAAAWEPGYHRQQTAVIFQDSKLFGRRYHANLTATLGVEGGSNEFDAERGRKMVEHLNAVVHAAPRFSLRSGSVERGSLCNTVDQKPVLPAPIMKVMSTEVFDMTTTTMPLTTEEIADDVEGLATTTPMPGNAIQISKRIYELTADARDCAEMPILKYTRVLPSFCCGQQSYWRVAAKKNRLRWQVIDHSYNQLDESVEDISVARLPFRRDNSEVKIHFNAFRIVAYIHSVSLTCERADGAIIDLLE